MESVSLYSEARNEYLKQLATWIVPPLVEFFRNEYNTIAAKEGKRAMSIFQSWCSEVPRWNQDIIDSNVTLILDTCRCDYVQELMTAVFIAHTKMLTAIRVSSKNKKLQINLPKLNHFLHRVFVECARSFWKAPFLFSDELSLIEKQKNVLQAESMCIEALSGAVRSLLPVKSILQDYLNEDDSDSSSDESSSDEEIPQPLPKKKHKKYVEVDEDEAPSIASVAERQVEPVAVVEKHAEPVAVIEKHAEPVAVVEKHTEPVPVAVVEKHAEPVPVAVVEKHTESVAVVESVEPVVEKYIEPIVEKPVATPPTAGGGDPSLKDPIPIPEKKEEPDTSKKFNLIKNEVQELSIDTEPSVRFSDYETVFDETKPEVSEIRYAPKMSIEEMDDDDWGSATRLNISSESSVLDGIEIESYDPTPVASKVEEDLEEPKPLDFTDFEEI
jgi:hypothetical protein